MEHLSRRSILTGAAGAGVVRAPGAAAAEAPLGAGPFNLIVIVMDTWGAHWLNCYGHSQVRTPHVDALASKSAMLLDAYPEALPTLPARRAIYTGRHIFPSPLILQRDDGPVIRGWHQLYAEDVTLAEALRGAGYRCGLVTDVYHQFKPDKNFHRGFDSWRYIRGQEGDRLESGPRKAVNLADYVHPSQAALLKRP
ncbi:MAG: sulfatase-like hydrolase/transferase, partial [Acidobacteriota bacterium]